MAPEHSSLEPQLTARQAAIEEGRRRMERGDASGKILLERAGFSLLMLAEKANLAGVAAATRGILSAVSAGLTPDSSDLDRELGSVLPATGEVEPAGGSLIAGAKGNPAAAAPSAAGVQAEKGKRVAQGSTSSVEGLTVLLAEDDPMAAGLLGHYLESLGVQVHHFPDGEAALQGAEERPWDAAVLDIRMPGMSGLDLLRRLRAREDFFGKPILMLTSVADETTIKEAFRQGADDYLLKPFSPPDVWSRLLRLMTSSPVILNT